MSRTFQVTLSGRSNGTAYVVADKVLRIQPPLDAYDRDARCEIIQTGGDKIMVQEWPDEVRRRYDACHITAVEEGSR